ncbi:hypothetical protein ABTB76_19330, partial [Acinetobacter baumannii]
MRADDATNCVASGNDRRHDEAGFVPGARYRVRERDPLVNSVPTQQSESGPSSALLMGSAMIVMPGFALRL